MDLKTLLQQLEKDPKEMLLLQHGQEKYKKMYAQKVRLDENICIDKFNFKTIKKLGKNSFANTIIYDISDCWQINSCKKKLLFELDQLLPEYDTIIKAKSATYFKHEEGKFNTIQFVIDKDESDGNQKLWASIVLSYDEEHAKEIALQKNEEENAM